MVRKFVADVLNELNKRKLDFTVNGILFVGKVLACLLLYYVVLKFIKMLLPAFQKTTLNSKIDSSLKSFMKSLFKIGIHAALITLCLLILGVKETSLLTFFGTIGIGVGLALKDNLSNLASGIIILFFKTYKVGDEVSIAGEMGYIHDIDMFFTSVKTHNEDIVTVPNGMVISNKLINYTKIPTRRLKIVIGVDYNCDLGVAREALENILRKNPKILKTPEPYTHVDSYGDNAINIALKGWTSNEHYWEVYKETLNEIKGALDKVNVNIPYPQMDINIKK